LLFLLKRPVYANINGGRLLRPDIDLVYFRITAVFVWTYI